MDKQVIACELLKVAKELTNADYWEDVGIALNKARMITKRVIGDKPRAKEKKVEKLILDAYRGVLKLQEGD